MSSSIQTLVNELANRASEVQHETEVSRSMHELFERAVSQTMNEIKLGADSDSFQELTVINFIIASHHEGHSPYDIRKFIHLISDEEDVALPTLL